MGNIISQIYLVKLYIFRINLSVIRNLNTVYTEIANFHNSYVDCLPVRSGWNSLRIQEEVTL